MCTEHDHEHSKAAGCRERASTDWRVWPSGDIQRSTPSRRTCQRFPFQGGFTKTTSWSVARIFHTHQGGNFSSLCATECTDTCAVGSSVPSWLYMTSVFHHSYATEPAAKLASEPATEPAADHATEQHVCHHLLSFWRHERICYWEPSESICGESNFMIGFKEMPLIIQGYYLGEKWKHISLFIFFLFCCFLHLFLMNLDRVSSSRIWKVVW